MSKFQFYCYNAYNFVLDTVFLMCVYEIAICLMLMKKRSYFGWRLLLFVPFIVLTNNTVGFINFVNDYLVFDYINVGYLIYFLVSVVICWFCFDDKLLHILYFCTAAYIIENFSSQIWNIFNLSLFGGSELFNIYNDPRPFLCSALMVVTELLVFWCAIFILVNHFRKGYDFRVQHIHILIIETATLCIIVFLNYYATMRGYMNLMTRIYAGIVDVTLLLIQFIFFKERQLQYENDVTSNLLKMQARQYEMSNENIDLINRKCHDLKHQIMLLNVFGGREVTEKIVSETADAVAIYDSYARTGNSVIDMMLTQKCLYCESKGIVLNYMLNGQRLAFIEDTDLTVLFGNALDNAIEAVEQEDSMNRIIDITMAENGSFVALRFENYCSRTLNFEKGLPISTKTFDGYHGFGTKSIAYIVKKYDGQCEMSQDGNHFVLRILFRIK